MRTRLTENNILVISCFTACTSLTTSTPLFTLILSPVRIAWSTRKLLDVMDNNRQSAGILSPTETTMISPGTSSDAWTLPTFPERRTVASSGEYSFRAFPCARIVRPCGEIGCRQRAKKVTHIYRTLCVCLLNHSNGCVCDENEKNYEWLYEGCRPAGRTIRFLEQCEDK